MIAALHVFGAGVLVLTGSGVRSGDTSLPVSWGTAMIGAAVAEVAAVAWMVMGA